MYASVHLKAPFFNRVTILYWKWSGHTHTHTFRHFFFLLFLASSNHKNNNNNKKLNVYAPRKCVCKTFVSMGVCIVLVFVDMSVPLGARPNAGHSCGLKNFPFFSLIYTTYATFYICIYFHFIGLDYCVQI